MKIEILYPEICTLYGDKGNTMYLQKCLPDAEFVTTGLNEKPLFLRENIDMVYMCSMSEKSQELVLDRLMQYKDEIAACKNRVIATYIHGPLLIQNPDFVHYLLKRLDAPMKEIPFEAAMRKAYDVKLAEYGKPDLELS